MSTSSLRSNWPTPIPSKSLRSYRATTPRRAGQPVRALQTSEELRFAEAEADRRSFEDDDRARTAPARMRDDSVLITSRELAEMRPAVLGRRERICPECGLVLLPSGACGSC